MRKSLSARRAWIEISGGTMVASGTYQSLSARRAWIEMQTISSLAKQMIVALRKESVD